MIVLDTNIWIDFHDTRFAQKRQIAKTHVHQATANLLLPWQVGCEFIAACRKLFAIGFSVDDAWNALDDMRKLAKSISLPTPDIWDDSRSLMLRFGLSSWDALLAAASIRGGATTLYTEDFGTLAAIDSLTVVHPFSTP